MGPIDWGILLLFLGYTLWDGIRHHGGAKNVEDLLLAKRQMSWWAIGLSVLATQASAITFIGTTGLAFMYDMRFVQFYLGTPIAMVILCVTLVPFFVRAKAFTAYEILEKRFGLSVRLSTSFLFLLSRGLAMGITIAAPAYVLSLILNLELTFTILIIGISATIYTMFGGIGGVIRTDVKQMVLMLAGLIICFGAIWLKLPDQIGFHNGLELAGALGKLKTIDFDFDLSEKYNIWSGLIAGTFLMLSYFGSDQSQVQRYLTSRSLGDARASLLLPAMVKIPMQFFILLLGASLYVFYIFGDRPLLFIPSDEVQTEFQQQVEFQELEAEFLELQTNRAASAIAYLENPSNRHQKQLKSLDTKAHLLRKEALTRLEAHTGQTRNDTNYILPYFILHELPAGLIGIIIAAIFAAALSSIDSILNSLTASTIMDWYQRLHVRKRSASHYLWVARGTTLFWGILATLAALLLGETESIIELVNKVGSYFYGSIFGVFILLWVKRATPTSVLIGLAVGILTVFTLSLLHQEMSTGIYGLFYDSPKGYHRVLEYLWLNPVGAVVVVAIGWGMGKS